MNASQSLGLGLTLAFGLGFVVAGIAMAIGGAYMVTGALYALLNAWLGR